MRLAAVLIVALHATVFSMNDADRRMVAAADSLDRSGSHTGIILASGAVGLTALLLKTDQHTSDALYSWKMRHHFISQVSRAVTTLGDGRPSLVFFGGTLAYSLAFTDPKLKEMGVIGLESFALSGIATQLLKQVFSRQQPNVSTRSGGTFFGPFAFFRQTGSLRHGMSYYDAFPSGHTATAFAAATTLADLCGDRWVSYSSYAIASMVGISRITERAHWASDVFVGGMLGYFSTKYVEEANGRTRSISLSPRAGDRGLGVLLSVKL